MTPQDIADLRTVFVEALEPVHHQFELVRGVLSDHGRRLDQLTAIVNEHTVILNEHTRLLSSLDYRLTNVEGTLDGVEILVRRNTG